MKYIKYFEMNIGRKPKDDKYVDSLKIRREKLIMISDCLQEIFDKFNIIETDRPVFNRSEPTPSSLSTPGIWYDDGYVIKIYFQRHIFFDRVSEEIERLRTVIESRIFDSIIVNYGITWISVRPKS